MFSFKLLLAGASLVLSSSAAWAQGNRTFTLAEIKAVSSVGSGLSGPGQPVKGTGAGGWRSGSAGVLYAGPNPKPEWGPLAPKQASGSVVQAGLLPNIRPIWDLHLRDTIIRLGGDGYYYMTGSSGDNIWAHTDGVELWRSKDLKKWEYRGLVWSIEKDGTWEKQWRDLHDKPARAVWAPEINYIKGNYYICLSMAPGGVSILRSTTGKAEGPYKNILSDSSKPIVDGIDATLFEDEDGQVYFTWSKANRIVRMKDDMSGFAEPLRDVQLLDPDHDPTHHAAKCEKRGMNDLGHEGAVLFKANGKYYLGAADDYQGRYSSCVAVADNVYGPYRMRHETVPCGGGTCFFKDKQGNWWSTFFGNDDQAPWREKPGLVKVTFAPDGKITVAKDQPAFVLQQ